MSRLYFHSEHDTAELRGSERAHMGVMINDIMMGILGDLSESESWLKKIILPDHYLQQYTGKQFDMACSTFLRVAMGDKLYLPSGPIEPWVVGLNTACKMGDQLKLFARLHGQCEVHCWMEGEQDKNWVADIIEDGLKFEIMRQDQGWDHVVELLRTKGDFPVVCSYSVCDQFPNFDFIPDNHPLKASVDEDGEDDAQDKFYDMDDAEKWKLCMEGLRKVDNGLQITQSTWKDFHFGDDRNVTAFNLAEYAQKIA